MADLQCPKCVASMHSVERNGITIERCTECGGIFLDRGELERLTQAENTYIAANTRGYRDDDDDDDDTDRFTTERGEHGHERGDDTDSQGHYPRKKKRRGFLSDLLDFG